MKSKPKIVVVVLVLMFLTNCPSDTEVPNTKSGPIKIIIPKREFGDLKKAVDWGASQGSLGVLRKKRFGPDDFEARIWISEGVGKRVGTSGIALLKERRKWSATYVDRMFLNDMTHENRSAVPRSEFEVLWRKLERAGITELPDSRDLKDYEGEKYLDSYQYVIEYNKDGVYRVYSYYAPGGDRHEQSRRVCVIGDIIASEFGLEEFKCDAG